MKKKVDPRHRKRVKIMKALFAKKFNKDSTSNLEDLEEVLENQKKIDKIIAKNAPAWPVEQIASVDLATLRLAIWELKFKKKKEPYKAVIDEAVEIAKEYGSESSASFINGVLGAVINQSQKAKVERKLS